MVFFCSGNASTIILELHLSHLKSQFCNKIDSELNQAYKNKVNLAVALTYMYRLMFKNVSGMVFSKFTTIFYYDLKLSGSFLCNETQKRG